MEIPSLGRALARHGGKQLLPRSWKDRLSALALFHDFGKANIGFQTLAAGHITEAVFLLGPTMLKESGLSALNSWCPDGAQALLLVSLGHHGAPPDFSDRDRHERLWRKSGMRDPVADVVGLVDLARSIWPDAFLEGGESLPAANSPFWHAYLGVLQLADWLGSDDAIDAFPFSLSASEDRLPFARKRAAELVTRIGLDAKLLRSQSSADSTFDALFFFPPTEIQTAAADAPGPAVVLESETGSGKTEAALWRFFKLFCAERVDALYFALPTRAAATQIHRRIQTAARQMFGDAAPEVVLALPGSAGAGAARLKTLPDFVVQWSDDPDDELRRSRWPAERPKRFLAAPIAVGTIDQALLGAVKVKHAHLRSFCLSRALLVVDEVHASDAYMETLLTRLLEQHRRAGGEALLLSATLGAAARTRLLLGGKSKVPVPAALDASALPYPALSYVDGPTIRTDGKSGRNRAKEVSVSPLNGAGEPETIARLAVAAAAQGAKVLVIRNTVSDAVAVARVLETAALDAPHLFKVRGVPTLHHGRFALSDRELLDAEVERRIGKGSPPEALALVGSQTLEQSLDIDADLLITDLAPMDVLLQRIGRLHRHDRSRPEGFMQPRCIVLAQDNLESIVDVATMRGAHGLGTVYQNLLSLQATREAIGSGATWRIPEDNRRLVEAATHPHALEALAERLARGNSRWSKVETDVDGRHYAARGMAVAAAVEWTSPACLFRLADEKIATRLGLGDRTVRFSTAAPSPFPSAPTIESIDIPEHLLRGLGVVNTLADEPVDITQFEGGFTFAVETLVFQYSKFGLEKIDR